MLTNAKTEKHEAPYRINKCQNTGLSTGKNQQDIKQLIIQKLLGFDHDAISLA